MGKTRPPYAPEFRLEAVRLLRSGVPLKQLAADLGCSAITLRHWRDQDQADRGELGGGLLSSDERARLRELERENRLLRQEREILKRAAAFFARESDRP
jgi:transposase